MVFVLGGKHPVLFGSPLMLIVELGCEFPLEVALAGVGGTCVVADEDHGLYALRVSTLCGAPCPMPALGVLPKRSIGDEVPGGGGGCLVGV